MPVYNYNFINEDEKKEFVLLCEEGFRSQLSRAAADIADDAGLKIITLSGPTCSGKTTTANTLIKDLGQAGRRVRVISIDDFYLSRDELMKKAELTGTPFDMDSFNTIDGGSLSECIEDFFRGGKVRYPKYDFKTGKRSGYESFEASDYEIVLFEGIQAIYPEVTAMFGGHAYKSIYISVGDDITVNGQIFNRREIRFLRRMVRDNLFRNSSPAFTFESWDGVTENEKKNIEPYAGGADINISSLMAYEPCILKKPVLRLLSEIGDNSKYSDRARGIAGKFIDIPHIDSEYIPSDSVYREFIG